MIIDKFLPILGTALLVATTVIVGQKALTPTPEIALLDTPSTPGPGLIGGNTITRRPTVPSVRPEIYYNAILDRPLFAPTRAPRRAETETAHPTAEETLQNTPVATNAPPSDVHLSGIIGEVNNRSALLGLDDTYGSWVRVDDEIEGWTITEIGADWLELSLDSQTYRLELFE